MNEPARCGLKFFLRASVLQAASSAGIAKRPETRSQASIRRLAAAAWDAPHDFCLANWQKAGKKAPSLRCGGRKERRGSPGQPRKAPTCTNMAAVLQAQDAPAAQVLQPADNPDVDIVPLRFGVKYASDAPTLALEYRDKTTGELKLEEIPLAIQGDSKALEVYAALKETHSRFLAPYVVSVAQVVRLIQLAIDNRGKAPAQPPRGDVPIRTPPEAPPTPLSPDVPSVASSMDSPAVLASPNSPDVLASPKAAPESPPVLASPASPPEIPTLASPPPAGGEPKFAVGDRIEARFEGKATYYAGNITEATGSTYSIAYDDGDHESNVAEDLIRVYAKTDDYSEDDVEEESIAESVGSTASFDASEPSRAEASDSDSDEAYAFD